MLLQAGFDLEGHTGVVLGAGLLDAKGSQGALRVALGRIVAEINQPHLFAGPADKIINRALLLLGRMRAGVHRGSLRRTPRV